MAASAIVLILVLVLTIYLTNSSNSSEIGNVGLLLAGCLVGIIIAAITTSCVVYCARRNRKAAMNDWNILVPGDNPAQVASNSSSYFKNQESVSVVSPSPACSCHAGTTTTTTQQKKISTVINHTESNHYRDTKIIMDEERHKMTTRQPKQLDFTSGCTLNQTQENNDPVVVTVPNRFEDLALDQDNVKRVNSSQLESYC